MDYVPGERLVDCWDEMGVPQKTRTAKDLARALAETFALTASHCGVLRDRGAHAEVVDGDFVIGPVNDITFLQLTKPAPRRSVRPSRPNAPSSRHLDTGTRAGGPRRAIGCTYGRSTGCSKSTMSSGRCTRPASTPRRHSTSPTQISAAQT